jgi:hypothetical protein
MADGVLGKALWPAPHYGYLRLGQWAEDMCQFESGYGGYFVIAAAYQPFCGISAKEGAYQLSILRHAVGELLVYKGAR